MFSGLPSTVLLALCHADRRPGSAVSEESDRQTQGFPLTMDCPPQDLWYKRKIQHPHSHGIPKKQFTGLGEGVICFEGGLF